MSPNSLFILFPSHVFPRLLRFLLRASTHHQTPAERTLHDVVWRSRALRAVDMLSHPPPPLLLLQLPSSKLPAHILDERVPFSSIAADNIADRTEYRSATQVRIRVRASETMALEDQIIQHSFFFEKYHNNARLLLLLHFLCVRHTSKCEDGTRRCGGVEIIKKEREKETSQMGYIQKAVTSCGMMRRD